MKYRDPSEPTAANCVASVGQHDAPKSCACPTSMAAAVAATWKEPTHAAMTVHNNINIYKYDII